MKKLLSVFLALALLLSFVTPAFAYQGAKTADLSLIHISEPTRP